MPLRGRRPVNRHARQSELSIDIDRGDQASERSAFCLCGCRFGFIAASTLTVGLSLLLVSVPSQQLNQFGSQSLWNSIGLTDIRTQVSDWSGGRLPLKGATTPTFGHPFPPPP